MRRESGQPIAQKWTGPYGGCLLLMNTIFPKSNLLFDVVIKERLSEIEQAPTTEGAHF
jgi:hypothetical protein